MAKVVGPLHSDQARGRLGDLVFGESHGIGFVRNYTAPIFGTPDPRDAQKARIAAANTAWLSLSQAQHESWSIYAQAHPRLDWTAIPFRISGYNAFVSCFTICLRAGGTPLADPPSSQPPTPLSSLSSSQIGNDISIAWVSTSQPEAHTYVVHIFRSGPWSLGRVPDFHRSKLVAMPDIATSPFTDTINQNGRYGYWARVVDASTGETSCFLRCQADFVYVPPGGSVVEGPFSAGTVTDVALFGTQAWSNLENVKVQDNIYSDATVGTSHPLSHVCLCQNFGFSSSIHDDAVIDGIVLEVDRYAGGTNFLDHLTPQIANEFGVLCGTAKPSGTPWQTIPSNTYIIYGTSSDDWDVPVITGAMVKSANFGVGIAVNHAGSTILPAHLDHVRMTIYATNP